VILEVGKRPNFAASYALLWDHFNAHYRDAGETDFGNPYSNGYQVLVPKDRPSVRMYPKWSLPCFALAPDRKTRRPGGNRRHCNVGATTAAHGLVKKSGTPSAPLRTGQGSAAAGGSDSWSSCTM
jgi:hypothetical protein